MANTTQTAKTAATEDKLPTGPAKLPNTKPVGVKPRLSDEERQKRAAQMVADHERLLQARTQQVCSLLKDMGVASLAGRLTAYDDVSEPFALAAVQEVQDRLNACVAAIKARSASKPAAVKVNLAARAAALAAQTNGTPAVGQ